MKNIFGAQNFTARVLTPRDWQSYKDFCHCFSAGDVRTLRSFIQSAEIETPEAWQNFLSRKDGKSFGLLHGDRMIGASHIEFENNRATFTGLMIEQSYRGNGLSTHLHDVRKRYLSDIQFKGEVKTQILIGNDASLRAAQKSGFTICNTNTECGIGWEATYHILELNL